MHEHLLNGHPENFDLVCLSHLRWDFVFQRPQHLLSRFAKTRRVFYFEEPVFENRLEPELEMSPRKEGVIVAVPHLPAGATPEQAIDMQCRLIDEMFDRSLIRQYVLWYYTPMALAFSGHLKPAAVVYDCMDELSNFKGASPLLKQMERLLCKNSDLIFTGGQSLYEAKRELHQNVYPFPSSVDVPHFMRARKPVREPKDQAAIPHPRLGFYGVIDERMDLELIRSLAERRPEWQIVLLGPTAKISPGSLPRRDNIHYLGQKSYDELPLYLAGWDAALLPFAKNDATRFISPTKTPEYMAGGCPVVSTSIRDVARPYGEQGLVRIADDAAGFERAIEESLREDAAERLARFDAALSTMSWDRTWSQMNALIADALRKKRAAAPQNGQAHANGKVKSALIAPYEFEIHLSNGSANGKAKPAAIHRKRYDFLVVGAGFAGSVIAECLASGLNKKVLICDKRPHVGGNAYDHLDSSGMLVHKYGPHIFHTNSEKVFHYLSRFTEWRPYEHRVLASVDGKLLPIPINLDTVNRLYGWNLDSEGLERFFKEVAEPRAELRTSEDVIISKVGRELYEKFFRNYTRKQWGRDPSELDSSVIARIPVRTDRDDRYFTDAYQAMPKHGFTRMFERMLDHPNITIELGVDYRELAGKVSYEQMVYSGPVDSYFDYCYGRLPYRSLEFKFETLNRPVHQAGPVINYPNERAYTRVTEFKYLTGQKHPKTSLVYEFPQAEGDPYYPIPCPQNHELYQKYQALAQRTRGVHFVGRLGTYRYYNMDQVVGQALTLSLKIAAASGAGKLPAEHEAGYAKSGA